MSRKRELIFQAHSAGASFVCVHEHPGAHLCISSPGRASQIGMVALLVIPRVAANVTGTHWGLGHLSSNITYNFVFVFIFNWRLYKNSKRDYAES